MHRLSIATALLLGASAAGAQGNLGQQGFGYPPGQLSTRALAVGGSLAEFDAQSPINPAALGSWGPAGLYMQYDPEFRSVTQGGREASTTTARFPVIAIGVPVGARLTVGLSAATLLDRTWQTSFESTQELRGQQVLSTETFGSDGAINDVRAALAFTPVPSLRLGVGLHALTGENRLLVARSFSLPAGAPTVDSSAFGTFQQRSRINYSGSAISVGAEWRPVRRLAVAASGRKGGDIRARDESDVVLGTGTAPDRYGAAVRVDLNGATIGARVDHERWSQLAGLTRDGLPVRDATEYALGAEVAGPRIARRAIALRAGGRWRALPFGVRADPAILLPAALDVDELAITGGIGIPVADRATLDLAAQRASRSADGRGDVTERSWTVSVGVRVRP